MLLSFKIKAQAYSVCTLLYIFTHTSANFWGTGIRGGQDRFKKWSISGDTWVSFNADACFPFKWDGCSSLCREDVADNQGFSHAHNAGLSIQTTSCKNQSVQTQERCDGFFLPPLLPSERGSNTLGWVTVCLKRDCDKSWAMKGVWRSGDVQSHFWGFSKNEQLGLSSRRLVSLRLLAESAPNIFVHPNRRLSTSFLFRSLCLSL